MGIKSIEVWNEACFLLSENIRSDISEKDFENQVIRVVEKLGWSEFAGEISRQPEIKIGRNIKIRPDIMICSPEGNPLIVIEVKRPSERLSKEEPADQLMSYMLQTRAEFGLLIGRSIRLFYDGKENPQRKPLLLDRISFGKDNDKGAALISALHRDSFINGKYKSYIADLIKKFTADRNIKKLREILLSEITKNKILEFLREEYSVYGSDVIEGALGDLTLNLSFDLGLFSKIEPLTVNAKESMAKTVFDIIKQHPKGINKSKLIGLTGFTGKQVSNVIYKLTKQDDIKSGQRGIYLENPKIMPDKGTTIVAPKNKTNSSNRKIVKRNKTLADLVFEEIKKKNEGIQKTKIIEKTGLKNKSVSNILYKLTKKGAVLNKGKGIYVALTESIPPGKISYPAGSLSVVSKDTFLESLDENGKAVFKKILQYADDTSLPIHWGSKGFSMNVPKNGVHVALCYGYPPNSVFKQSLYTALVGRGGFLKKLDVSESEIQHLWNEAQDTGLFQSAGRELKVVIDRKLSGAEIDLIFKWLKRVINTIGKHELK